MFDSKKKICTRCSKLKPLSEFPKQGRENTCKACKVDIAREWYQNNAEKAKKYKQEYYRAHSEEIKAHVRRRDIENPERARVRKQEWRQNNLEKERVKVRLFQVKHPEIYKAQQAVGNAVRNGKLPRVTTLKCHECGDQAANYHHHRGYSREHWLDVIPVCISCHRKLDRSTS